MKKKGLLLTWLITVILAITMMPFDSFAAAKDNYKYTVRVYTGEQGFIDGENYYEETFDGDGTGRFSFDLGDVKVKDNSKYYVKGIRLSGRDNSELINPSFEVKADTDLVIAYGIKGLKMVKYTVKYVDAATGKDLIKSEDFYANDGEKPVVAYKYIENYRPRYYNVTKTVGEGKDNTLTFKYDYMKEDVASAADSASEDVKKNRASFDWFGFMITAYADSGEGEVAEDADFSKEPVELYDLDEGEASEDISGEAAGNPEEEMTEETETASEPEEPAPEKSVKSYIKKIAVVIVFAAVLLIIMLAWTGRKKK